MKTARLSTILSFIIIACCFNLSKAESIGTAFTYEGHFMDANEPAEGIYDLQLILYDDPDPKYGIQVGCINEVNDCNITNGFFTVDLDFSLGDPNVFNGQKRWLEIGYRNGQLKDPNEYTIVEPRLEILAVPYALYAVSGTPGPQGPKGDTGDTGPMGPQGLPGDSHWRLNGLDTFYTDGKVGIGTSSPGTELEVLGEISVNNNNSEGRAVTGYASDNGVAQNYGGYFQANSSNGIGVYGSGVYQGVYGYSYSGTAGYFSSGAGYGLIVGEGRVGIGVTYPGSLLEIKAANGNSSGGLRLVSSTNSHTVIHIQDAGDKGLISLRAGGADKIALRASGNTYFNGGNVGIGTTSPGSYKLAVNGTAAKTGGGSWSTFSDIRLKELKGNYERGLSEINKLNPVLYNYKDDNELNLPSNREFVGFVAQDVQKVIPEAVETNDDGYLLINNDPVIWTMINAIKELKAENDLLKEKVEALEKKLQ